MTRKEAENIKAGLRVQGVCNDKDTGKYIKVFVNWFDAFIDSFIDLTDIEIQNEVISQALERQQERFK